MNITKEEYLIDKKEYFIRKDIAYELYLKYKQLNSKELTKEEFSIYFEDWINKTGTHLPFYWEYLDKHFNLLFININNTWKELN
jgi:hypothetical protein